jgi:hypothetical protein
VVKIHAPSTQSHPTSGQQTKDSPLEVPHWTVPCGHSQSPIEPSRQQAPVPLWVYPGGQSGGGGVV